MSYTRRVEPMSRARYLYIAALLNVFVFVGCPDDWSYDTCEQSCVIPSWSEYYSIATGTVDCSQACAEDEVCSEQCGYEFDADVAVMVDEYDDCIGECDPDPCIEPRETCKEVCALHQNQSEEWWACIDECSLQFFSCIGLDADCIAACPRIQDCMHENGACYTICIASCGAATIGCALDCL